MNGVSIYGFLNDDKEKVFHATYNFDVKSISGTSVNAELKDECVEIRCK